MYGNVSEEIFYADERSVASTDLDSRHDVELSSVAFRQLLLRMIAIVTI